MVNLEPWRTRFSTTGRTVVLENFGQVFELDDSQS